MSPEKTTAVIGSAGSVSAVAFGLSANEIAALGGLCVAVLAFSANIAITIYFTRQHLAIVRAQVEQHPTAMCAICPIAKNAADPP